MGRLIFSTEFIMSKFIFAILIFTVLTFTVAEPKIDPTKNRHQELLKQYNHLPFLEGVYALLPTKFSPTSVFELPSQASLYTKLEKTEIYSLAEIQIDQKGQLRITQNIDLIKNYTTHSLSFVLSVDLDSGRNCNIEILKNTHPEIINQRILVAVGKVTLFGIMECVAPGREQVRCGTLTSKLANVLPEFVKTLEKKPEPVRK